MKNTSGIYPKGNRIVVKPDELEEVTAGGIVIPNPVKEKHQQGQAMGTVIAIGPDAWIESTTTVYRLITGELKAVEKHVSGYTEKFAEVGDRVFFARYAGLQVEGADGKSYRILNDLDITTKIDEGVSFGDIKSRKAVHE
jgi:chaperonin GroES